MCWNTLEIVLMLTLSIGIAVTSPINDLKENDAFTSLSKKNVSAEITSLLSVNSTKFDTIEIRKLHIDEESESESESFKNLNNDVVNDSDTEIVDADLKYEVEILQPGKIEKENIEIEERFKAPSLHFETDEFIDENIEVNGGGIQQTHLILTIVLFAMAIVSIATYFGLIMWRSSLEKRYGMRQRLMTDDDFCANIDDTRPF